MSKLSKLNSFLSPGLKLTINHKEYFSLGCDPKKPKNGALPGKELPPEPIPRPVRVIPAYNLRLSRQSYPRITPRRPKLMR